MSDSSFDLATSATPGAEAPSTPAPAGAPADTGTPGGSQDQLFELKYRGRTEKVPLDRARELAQMGYDYTTKMQELAREREAAKAWEGQRHQYDQAIAEIRTFLQDKARIEQYLREAFNQQAEGGEPQPLSQQDVQRMLAQQRQELMGLTQQQLAQLQAQQQIDGLAQQYSQQFDSHVRQLADTMPELKSIPKLAKLLKEEVGEMGPRNPEEAKAMMTELARQWQGQIKAQQLESRKQQGPTPNPALSRGIEPPGGAGPMPPAQPNYKGKITDQAFKDLVMRDILGTMTER